MNTFNFTNKNVEKFKNEIQDVEPKLYWGGVTFFDTYTISYTNGKTKENGKPDYDTKIFRGLLNANSFKNMIESFGYKHEKESK